MKAKQFRLSLMMFLQFFIAGCIMPIFSLYLKQNLHFSGTQIGIILAMSAVPSFLSPLVGAFVADRLISAERLLSVCLFAGAAVMAGLYMHSTFYPVLFFYLMYGLITGPTFGLTTAITFHHAPDAIKNFGGIRLWGTLGWFTAAWFFSYFWTGRSSSITTGELHGALLLAAITSVLFGIYSLTLPVGLKRKKDRVVIIPKDSLQVILQPGILIISLLCLIITFADRFYTFGGAPYLKSLGFSDKSIMPALSIGQIPEIIGLVFLGSILKKIGLKKTLMIGAGFEIARFAFFLISKNDFTLFCGISLHGLTYAYFFVPTTIFLDNHSTRHSRAGAHQLFSIITGGIGGFAGNLLAGFAADSSLQSGSDQINFGIFWIVPLVLSAVGLLGICIFLQEQKFEPKPVAIENSIV